MKKIIILIFVLLTSSECWGIDTPLKDFYKEFNMDDYRKDIVLDVDFDNIHNFHDMSKYHHGVGIVGDFRGCPNCKIKGGAVFDGKSSYLSIADNSILQFGDGTKDTPFTIVSFMYVPRVDGFNIFTRYHTSDVAKRELIYDFGAAQILRIIFRDTGAGVNINTVSNSKIEQGWNFIVTRYDGRGGATAMNGVDMFVNGSMVDVTRTNNAAYGAMDDTAANTVIGSRDGETPAVSTSMASFRIYRRYLSISEINQLYLWYSKNYGSK